MSTTLATRRDYRKDALSPEQRDFIKSLVDQIAEIWPGKGRELREALNKEYLAKTLTGARASEWIDGLKGLRNDVRARQHELQAQLDQVEVPSQRAVEPRPEVPSGRYAVDTEEGVTGFYRVANKDGHYQVYVYAGPNQHRIPGWKAQKAILRKIEHDGLDAAGIRFGIERGECDKCGVQLTDEESRRLGRGPICGGRRAR
jgi:hypothetical protein